MAAGPEPRGPGGLRLRGRRVRAERRSSPSPPTATALSLGALHRRRRARGGSSSCPIPPRRRAAGLAGDLLVSVIRAGVLPARTRSCGSRAPSRSWRGGVTPARPATRLRPMDFGLSGSEQAFADEVRGFLARPPAGDVSRGRHRRGLRLRARTRGPSPRALASSGWLSMALAARARRPGRGRSSYLAGPARGAGRRRRAVRPARGLPAGRPSSIIRERLGDAAARDPAAASRAARPRSGRATASPTPARTCSRSRREPRARRRSTACLDGRKIWSRATRASRPTGLSSRAPIPRRDAGTVASAC